MTQSTHLAMVGVAASLALAGLANKALSDRLESAGRDGQGWFAVAAAGVSEQQYAIWSTEKRLVANAPDPGPQGMRVTFTLPT